MKYWQGLKRQILNKEHVCTPVYMFIHWYTCATPLGLSSVSQEFTCEEGTDAGTKQTNKQRYFFF